MSSSEAKSDLTLTSEVTDKSDAKCDEGEQAQLNRKTEAIVNGQEQESKPDPAIITNYEDSTKEAFEAIASPEVEAKVNNSEPGDGHLIKNAVEVDSQAAATNDVKTSAAGNDVHEVGEHDETSEQEENEGWIFVLGHDKLKKKKLKAGDGISSRPQNGDVVTVSYSGCLGNGTEVDKHEQHTFILGDGDVIQALDLCVALMELHEVCLIATEAQYAYGAKGRDPDIPADSKLTYTIELLNVEGAPDYSTWPIIKRIEEGNKKKERGNELYSRAEYSLAINSYAKALAMLDDSKETTHDATVEDLQLLLDTRMTYFNNLAAAQIKVEAWDAAIQSCDEVLKKQPENVKALFRKGKCLSNKGELEAAIVCLQKALKLEPSSKFIHQELSRLKTKNRKQDKSQAVMYQRMFWGNNESRQKSKTQKSLWWLYAGGAISAAVISVAVAAYRYMHT